MFDLLESPSISVSLTEKQMRSRGKIHIITNAEDRRYSFNSLPSKETKAIVKSMRFAFSRLIEAQLDKKHRFLDEDSLTMKNVDGHDFFQPNEVFPLSTYKKCEEASTMALDYIINNFANLFEESYLLSCPQTQIPFSRNPTWTNHTYLFLKDKESKYYAVSPANYGIPKPEPTSTIFFENNYQSLVKSIQRLEGGDWSKAIIKHPSQHIVSTSTSLNINKMITKFKS